MEMSDEAVLRELGSRLAAARVERNLSQASLAQKAGVGKRTLERLEHGEVGVQLSSFVRVCRALGLLERLDVLVAEVVPSPIEALKLQGKKKRSRAARRVKPARPGKKWIWSEP